MTDIILVTWGREELTRATLDSIKTNTKRGSYRLIVIDNNSPQVMVPMLLQEYMDGNIDKLILNSKNRGLEPARNQGLEIADNKYNRTNSK